MNRTLERISDQVVTQDNAWTLVTLVAVVAGAILGRKLLKGGWRAITGEEPPLNPDAEEVTWHSALGWAVVSGALVGLVRTLSRKGMSSARRRWA